MNSRLVSPSNPFCTRRVRPGALEYRFDELGPVETDSGRSRSDEIVDALLRHRSGLIVGAHGTGKSTLLHSLRPQLWNLFPDVEHVQLSASRNLNLLPRLRHAFRQAQSLFARQAVLRHGGLLVVDGAEQILRVHLAGLLRNARWNDQAVLATSHQPIGGIPVLYQTKVTRSLVVALTDSLLAEVSPDVNRAVRAELCQRDWSTLTNVRDLWFELYDVVQPHLIRESAHTSAPSSATQE